MCSNYTVVSKKYKFSVLRLRILIIAELAVSNMQEMIQISMKSFKVNGSFLKNERNMAKVDKVRVKKEKLLKKI